MLRALILLCGICAVLFVTVATEENVNEAADNLSSKTSVKDSKYVTAGDEPKCKYKNGVPNECLKKALQTMLGRYINDVKEKKFMSLEPARLNHTTLQFSYGDVKGHMTVRNVEVKGFSTQTFPRAELQVDKDKFKGHFLSVMPQMEFNGNYKAQVLVNDIQLKPKGIFNVTLTNVTFDIYADGIFYEKDDHRFMRITKLKVDMNMGDLNAKVTGIFDDPELNAVAVNLMNQQWKQIFSVVFPATKPVWLPLMLDGMNETLGAIPFDEFVIDDN